MHADLWSSKDRLQLCLQHHDNRWYIVRYMVVVLYYQEVGRQASIHCASDVIGNPRNTGKFIFFNPNNNHSKT